MKYSCYPSRDAIRNYFPLPNEIFQLGLTPGELAVYAFLLKCENRETYQCYPSYRTIGEAVGMSRNTVKKHVDSLVEKRLLYTEPTTVTLQDGTKRNGSLLYTIRPIQEAKEYYVEQQAKACGGSMKLVSYVRYEKGEGIEKRVDDFASEVASMVK